VCYFGILARTILFVLGFVFCFCVVSLVVVRLVISTSAADFLERLAPETICEKDIINSVHSSHSSTVDRGFQKGVC